MKVEWDVETRCILLVVTSYQKIMHRLELHQGMFSSDFLSGNDLIESR